MHWGSFVVVKESLVYWKLLLEDWVHKDTRPAIRVISHDACVRLGVITYLLNLAHLCRGDFARHLRRSNLSALAPLTVRVSFLAFSRSAFVDKRRSLVPVLAMSK